MKPLSLILVALAGSVADAVQSPPAPNCRRLDLPRRLPAMADLVDSAALASRLVGAPIAGSPEVELGLAFPRPSGSPQAWVIDSGDTPDAGARLAELVQAALRADGAPPGTTLRIHLRATPPIELRVQRSILCAPVPLDSEGSAQPVVQVAGGVRPAPPQRWNAVIRQRIGADGVVLDARLQPGSGKPELDRLALLPVFARRWQPATLDGRPVEAWFAKDRAELARP
jgi:hypothetical protein